MGKRKVFGISKDLNEGISQTINAAKNNAGQLRYEVIPLSKIKFDPHNPRKLALQAHELLEEGTFLPEDPLFERKKNDLESLKSLASSIRKSGVRNAVEVYKDGVDYRLISGERRVMGSILAGKEDIQARILDAKPSEFDIRYLQWIENIEREDLSIWERIQNVNQLITTYVHQENREVTASVLKEIIGCSLPHAMTYLAVLQAPADLQELLQTNAIANLEKAAFLAKIKEPDLRKKLIGLCIEGNASLAVLKKYLSDQVKISNSLKVSPRASKGRVAKRVTLGYTQKIKVTKHLMELALAQPQFKEFENTFKNIDWQDCASVSRGFQMLIRFMEKEIG